MPLIDYQDEVTGQVFETLIRSHDIPDSIISDITGNKCIRLLSKPSSFIFKGTGFYATDYKGLNQPEV